MNLLESALKRLGYTRAETIATPAAPPRVRTQQSTVSIQAGTPSPQIVNSGMGNYFEALRNSNDRTAIPQASVHVYPSLMRMTNGLNRKMIAAIGRYLVDNGGVPGYAVNLIANYSTPVMPQAQSGNPEWDRIAEDAYAEWCKQCDSTRRYTFEEMQRLICIAIDEDGDIGANITLKNDAPVLRLFETFQIGNAIGISDNEGVVVKKTDGELLGYDVLDSETSMFGNPKTRFITADQMILLHDVERYCNYRGFSPIRRGSNDIRDAADLKAFEKLRAKISSALAAVIQNTSMLEEDDWGNDTGTNGNLPDATLEGGGERNENPTPQEKKITLAELLGGDIPVISGELKQMATQVPGVNTVEFLSFLSGQFVMGLDLPPAFFLDEKLTGPNVRAVLGKVQRKFDVRKATMSKLVEFCWKRVIGWHIEKGLLPAQPNWWKIGFRFPQKLSIDLGDQASNDRQDVQAGQMSRRQRYGNSGLEWEREESQINTELDAILTQSSALAKKHDVPVELILSARGIGKGQIAQAKPDPEQDNEAAQPEKKSNTEKTP